MGADDSATIAARNDVWIGPGRRLGCVTSACYGRAMTDATNADNPEWWAWIQGGDRFTIKNQAGQKLYVVAESGADKRGTWHYTRTDGLLIGPVALGEVTRFDHPTADAAKAAAEEDLRQIVKLGEWFTYMVNHKPPA
jgi:hypothetical protein